ncbi:cobalamin biosynthesis protein [Pseudonocardia sp. KRD291]|uniref:cobalamin biosynthesis protein n=1 Tax=Pseudonocardia sp. KRD291 TaxID=2792007 RepID=UPI001C4A24EE|nr:cobalamin biosynthesis protein [Pseudonocardia sp. KRD291]MBW0105564.1 cobalamin biosynthesis protein [Pseudonocardia sp. KRD291]
MTGPATGLVVGIGARRGVGADAVRAALARVAREHGLDLGDAVVATVESKLGEPGLLRAIAPSVPVGVPAAVLARVEVPHPDDRAARAVGTASVAEAAALHTAHRLAGDTGAGPDVTLVVPKTAIDGVTVAVARYHRP